jgi:hypothetical protein
MGRDAVQFCRQLHSFVRTQSPSLYVTHIYLLQTTQAWSILCVCVCVGGGGGGLAHATVKNNTLANPS